MLAHTLSSDIHLLDDLWKPARGGPHFAPLEMGYAGLWRALVIFKGALFGGPLSSPKECRQVVMAALSLYAANRLPDARRLLDIESSNVTNCSPLAVSTRSDRAITGRISASRP
jgi:hypothetical protein